MLNARILINHMPPSALEETLTSFFEYFAGNEEEPIGQDAKDIVLALSEELMRNGASVQDASLIPDCLALVRLGAKAPTCGVTPRSAAGHVDASAEAACVSAELEWAKEAAPAST